MGQRYKTERLIISATHCNPAVELMGNVTGTTIIFGYKFVSAPIMTVTAIGGSTATAHIISKDTTNGYYTGATIYTYGCDSVDWTAKGIGIPEEEE